MNQIFKLLIMTFCMIVCFDNFYAEAKISWQEKAFLATESGDLEGLKEAFKNGADIEARDAKYKANVLDKAIIKRHTHIVKWLLENGVKTNAPGGNIPALHQAISRDNLEQAELLLKYGADIEAIDWHGNTPLLDASRSTRIEIFRLLIDKGANVNKQNKKGRTALYYACENGSDEKVKLLLEKGADPNISSHNGTTPLHTIIKWNSLGVGKAKLLLQYGAKLDAKNKDQLTPYELLRKRKSPDRELLELLNLKK